MHCIMSDPPCDLHTPPWNAWPDSLNQLHEGGNSGGSTDRMPGPSEKGEELPYFLHASTNKRLASQQDRPKTEKSDRLHVCKGSSNQVNTTRERDGPQNAAFPATEPKFAPSSSQEGSID
mmetsp:Transcript_11416/g.21984  ORF Transcript_11416/g.21984 Transcript_11416/m.21984 type:complete len:120 (-) Transcript_11416:470-829(-)